MDGFKELCTSLRPNGTSVNVKFVCQSQAIGEVLSELLSVRNVVLYILSGILPTNIPSGEVLKTVWGLGEAKFNYLPEKPRASRNTHVYLINHVNPIVRAHYNLDSSAVPTRGA
jgi:hypothetical protein